MSGLASSSKELKVSVRDEFRRFIADVDLTLTVDEGLIIQPERREGFYTYFIKPQSAKSFTLNLQHPDYTGRQVNIYPDNLARQTITLFLGKKGDRFYRDPVEGLIPFTPFPKRIALIPQPDLYRDKVARTQFKNWLQDLGLQLDKQFPKVAQQALAQDQVFWHSWIVKRLDGQAFDQQNSRALALLRDHPKVLSAGPLLGQQYLLTERLKLAWQGKDAKGFSQRLEAKGLQIKSQANEWEVSAPLGMGLELLQLIETLYEEAEIEKVHLQAEPLFSIDDDD
ncbi:MAG: hypothetical protein AAFP19_07275 [Bacteroidota bacterium]